MMAETITTDGTLRGLLRTARRHARLSQREAAEKAGCSLSWWRRVESAYETKVTPDGMIDMLDAVGVHPEHLEQIDRPVLAVMLKNRQAFRIVSSDEGLEEYLMNAPAPPELREELIAYVRARTSTKPFRYRPEPFADQFWPER